MAPAPWGLRGCAKTIKINAIMHVFLHSLISSSQTAGTIVITIVIVIRIELSTKIVKFMAQISGVLVLVWDLMSIYR